MLLCGGVGVLMCVHVRACALARVCVFVAMHERPEVRRPARLPVRPVPMQQRRELHRDSQPQS